MATYWLKIANFPYSLSLSIPAWRDPFQIYETALQIPILVFQVADGEDLVILAYTVFDWSTHVLNRRTDRQNCDGQDKLKAVRSSTHVKCELRLKKITHPTSHVKIFVLILAESHFTIRQRVKSWVCLHGSLSTKMIYLPRDSHPSKY